MRTAVVSDIHGNLVAFEAVLAELRREGPEEVVWLGDVAATEPRPREVVESGMPHADWWTWGWPAGQAEFLAGDARTER